MNEFIKIPHRDSNNLETYALYMIRAKKRDKLLKFLNKNGIEAKVHYPRPLCLQKPYMMYDDKITSENAIKQSKELITFLCTNI